MNSHRKHTGQFSHIQLCILRGSLPSRAAFCCCSLQSIALQNINQIRPPAHSCKGQADHKISFLRKNGCRDFGIREMEETPESKCTSSRHHSTEGRGKREVCWGSGQAQFPLTRRDSEGPVQNWWCSPAHSHEHHTFGLQKGVGSSSQTFFQRKGHRGRSRGFCRETGESFTLSGRGRTALIFLSHSTVSSLYTVV